MFLQKVLVVLGIKLDETKTIQKQKDILGSWMSPGKKNNVLTNPLPKYSDFPNTFEIKTIRIFT